MRSFGVSFLSVQKSRKAKTQYFKNDLIGFYTQLIKEIESFNKRAKKLNLSPAIRLNLTSDIDFSRLMEGKQITPIFNLFPKIKFYDYTKDFSKICGNEFKNYHLTFSFSGENLNQCIFVLEKLKKNIAMVFTDLPERALRTRLANVGFSIRSITTQESSAISWIVC